MEKPKTVRVGNMTVTRVSPKEREILAQKIKQRHDRLRNKYREIHKKVVDWVSHSVEEGRRTCLATDFDRDRSGPDLIEVSELFGMMRQGNRSPSDFRKTFKVITQPPRIGSPERLSIELFLGADTLSAPERLLPERLLVHLRRSTGWSESSNGLFDRVLNVPGAVSGRTFSRRREEALCVSPVDPYPQAKHIGSILSMVNVRRNTEQIDLSPVSDRRVEIAPFGASSLGNAVDYRSGVDCLRQQHCGFKGRHSTFNTLCRFKFWSAPDR
jgi:hypothetical protein